MILNLQVCYHSFLSPACEKLIKRGYCRKFIMKTTIKPAIFPQQNLNVEATLRGEASPYEKKEETWFSNIGICMHICLIQGRS